MKFLYLSPSAGFQIRTRQMVNKGGDESSCGSRDEIRSCRLESCYSWKIRQDGPCKLNDVQSKCGVGRQNRIIECIKWDGVGRTRTELISTFPLCPCAVLIKTFI